MESKPVYISLLNWQAQCCQESQSTLITKTLYYIALSDSTIWFFLRKKNNGWNHNILRHKHLCTRDHFVHALSQCETMLHCNSLAGRIQEMIPSQSKDRRSWYGHLHYKEKTVLRHQIFIMEIHMLVRDHLYDEMVPRFPVVGGLFVSMSWWCCVCIVCEANAWANMIEINAWAR